MIGKTVQGIGYNDEKYPSRVEGKKIREYITWNGVLLRCTENSWIRRPSYTGTTCSENFKSYSYFYEWCNKQVGFGSLDANNEIWHLDKDLLVKGNKVYSEDTCVFVPKKINNLLVKSDALRGSHAIGVHLVKKTNKYTAQINNSYRVRQYLGCFNTEQEAFLVYKTHKEALIKQVANEYKDRLDSRAYEALMNYEVNIYD